MKIQPLSDIHFDCLPCEERSNIIQNFVNPEADVVVLAGDMCELEYIHALKRDLECIRKPIIYVAGNHEYWGSYCENFYCWLKSQFERLPHVKILDKESVQIDDVLFTGGTLWTNLSNPIEAEAIIRYMADFKRVTGLDVSWWNLEHQKTIEFLEAELKSMAEIQPDLKRVVVTHHGPSFSAVQDIYKGDISNAGFFSNLDHLLIETWSPDVWIHGHSHSFMDKKLGNTRVVRNPRGYVGYGETGSGFNPKFLIDTNNPE